MDKKREELREKLRREVLANTEKKVTKKSLQKILEELINKEREIVFIEDEASVDRSLNWLHIDTVFNGECDGDYFYIFYYKGQEFFLEHNGRSLKYEISLAPDIEKIKNRR